MFSISFAAIIVLFVHAPFSQSFKPLRTSITTSSRNQLRDSLVMKQEQLGRVTMYKKEGCPYCAKAIELLEGKYELDVNYVDIESAEREEILQQMRTFSGGRNTVPQIFFNSDHLGGNDDVQKLEADGVLAEKVDTVRKTAVSMMLSNWYHPWY